VIIIGQLYLFLIIIHHFKWCCLTTPGRPPPPTWVATHVCIACIYELQYLYSVSQVKLSSWQPHSQGRELKRKDNGNEIVILVGLHTLHAFLYIQLFQLRLSHEQSGKVEYERKRLLGFANKWMNLLAIPSSLICARIWLFRFAQGTTLIEIAVYATQIYIHMRNMIKCTLHQVLHAHLIKYLAYRLFYVYNNSDIYFLNCVYPNPPC
jgi:hypothetical protein